MNMMSTDSLNVNLMYCSMLLCIRRNIEAVLEEVLTKKTQLQLIFSVAEIGSHFLLLYPFCQK